MSFLFRHLTLLFLICSFTLSFASEFTNRLIHEDSPYLQQHAHNPVLWYPWGNEALNKAKNEHKPIFLSIGYSTCHWCHVMAHESFEDEAIAELINKEYIAIKVDREEFSHLDAYFQKLHRLVRNRSGGWPLTAILTEDAKPFFVATYIPPQAKYDSEGLDTLLVKFALDYKEKRQKTRLKAGEIEKLMQKEDRVEYPPVKIDLSITKEVYESLEKEFDDLYYGFSIQPKFPESSKIELLFDLDALGQTEAKEMALNVLRAMALHGLYDQVEGGFFRYSTDAGWEVPHFEKMLYTNAELIALYVKAYELTKDELYRQVIVETIDMIEDRFEDEGVYFSASDADSGHEEGGYFTYTYEEMTEAMKDLDEEEKSLLIEVLELSSIGNFKDKTHINFFSEKRPESFVKIKNKLRDIRKTREYPFIDKKINTAWNAMMIEALFAASAIDEKYLELAQKRMQSLLEKIYIKGVLYHQRLSSKPPLQKALLEDYAFLVSALIEAYAKDYDSPSLVLAKRLSNEAIKKFYDGRFWYLSEDSKPRIHADMQDKYYKAPVNKMLLALLKIASLSGERKYLEIVQEQMRSKSALLKKNPASYPAAIQVLLRAKKGYVTLKSSRPNLMQAKGKEIEYPFVLRKASSDIKAYMACDMGQCFSIDDRLEKVIESIEKR